MPPSISELIEQDAKQILWATDPSLHTHEDGSDPCKRWITQSASYPTQEGRSRSLMHRPSHCEAFHALWIIRYLHPRKSPWKQVVSYWIQDEHIGSSNVFAAWRSGWR
eukprot:5512786-Prymnesium_polylepis.1